MLAEEIMRRGTCEERTERRCPVQERNIRRPARRRSAGGSRPSAGNHRDGSEAGLRGREAKANA